MRNFFMSTDRIGFSKWNDDDFELAKQLWGNEDVTKYICATGKFSDSDILNRLQTEISNDKLHNVQYWCMFNINSNKLIGCCGLRPFDLDNNVYEIGVHLCKDAWGMGYGSEAMEKVISFAFTERKIDKLFAGHNPHNLSSKKLLTKLGFKFIGTNFYEPTGLYHPSYEITPL